VFSVQHVTLRFGGVTSLSDVSLSLNRGEILSIIGPNGAEDLSVQLPDRRLHAPRGLDNLHSEHGHAVSVVGRKPYKVNRLGVARTFQTSRMFMR